MANSLVRLPLPYVGDFKKGKPLFNAKLFIGEPDLDPEIPANQKTVTGRQEDGTLVTMAQPVRTSSGGYPIYNNAPIELLVDGAYSLKVLDKGDNQTYYFANVEDGVPITFDDKPVFYRDTVTEAKADVDLTVGMYVTTKGYSSPNDGGGAQYVVVAEGTGVADGGSYIDKTDGSGWQLELIKDSEIDVMRFGAVGDGVTDDYAAITNCFNFARSNGIKVVFPSGNFKINTALDHRGLDIEGVNGGFNNSIGTRITCNGTNSGFYQGGTALNDITYSIKNITVDNALWGLQMTYSVSSKIENFQVINSTNGIQCGITGTLGGLFNVFNKCWVDVTNVALSIKGDNFSNANKFDTCFFRGDTEAGQISAGGIGAVSNSFINTEFAGDGVGVVLGRSKATTFDGCYFETLGPCIKIDGFSLDVSLTDCTYAVLENTNAAGIDSFIWHASGSSSVKINGGYVFLGKTDGTQDNLSLIRSDAPSSFETNILLRPSQEVSAAGFSLFGVGLPNGNGVSNYTDDYTTIWSSAGAQPILGDGTLTAYHAFTGEMCVVNIFLKFGSTTTSGNNQWQFALPFKAERNAVGSAYILNAGSGNTTAICRVIAGSSLLVGYVGQDSPPIDNVTPQVWAAGDVLEMTITYKPSL